MKIEPAQAQEGEVLAELRVLAMRQSLEALGRFDPDRARQRFLDKFEPESTWKISIDSELVGFYVVTEGPNFLNLDHLYIHPKHQSMKIGSKVLKEIVEAGQNQGKSIKLGALKGSRSNKFYMSHNFVKIDEGEYDNYYELKHS